MKLYFGRAKESEDKSDLYEQDGKFYFYCLEMDDKDPESFTLKDTCGRSVPFDMEVANGLINMVAFARDYVIYNKANEYLTGAALRRLAKFYSLVPNE